MPNQERHSIPLELLFPTSMSPSENLQVQNLDAEWEAVLGPGVVVTGRPQIKTSGITTSDILIHAAITISTGVALNVASAIILNWLQNFNSKTIVRLGKMIIPTTKEGVKKAIEDILRENLPRF